MLERPPRALGWIGGKSFYGTHRTGRWINSLLPPPEATYTYVEPYAGMLGLLLQRRPAKREIVSDLDADLINWWTVVRDRPEELAELLEWTPGWSSDLFAEACHNLDHPDPVKRAYYFTLALHWVRGGMIERVRGTRNRQHKAEDDGIRRRIRGIGEPEPKRGYDGLIKRTKGTADDYDYDAAIKRSPDSYEGYYERVRARQAGQEQIIDPGISRYAVSPNEKWGDRDNRPGQQRMLTDQKVEGAEQTPDSIVSRMPVSPNEKYGDNDRRPDPDAAIRRNRDALFGWDRVPVKDRPGTDFSASKQSQPGRKAEQAPFKPGRPVKLSYDEMGPPRYDQIINLARRIRRLQLEVRSAEWMVEYYSVNPNLTIYLDPPYPSAEKSNLYSFPMPDIEEWIPRLMVVKGFCAISGYGNEWSALEEKGWFRSEHKTHMSAGAQGNMSRPERIEVLWTNYNPARFQTSQQNLF